MPSAGRGFVLLEVLLSTAIFAIVAIGFARSITAAAEAIRQSHRESEILLGLSNRLAEAQMHPVVLGTSREKTDARGVTYETEWTALKLENQAKAVLPNLYRLTVRAEWQQGKKADREEATIDVYRPRL
ncbi:MAG TPA: prepilin-type N-terminal cleavage/methylation domain-containing protein [Candidatus Methylacidiphilales bacterium]